MPCDFIYKRSDFVRKTVQWSVENGSKASIDFTTTPTRILEHFVIWTYAAEPALNKASCPEDVVELAIFAEIYCFEALHNQALDMLREKLAKEEWRLQPGIVERVYSAMHSNTPLRKMFRVLLNRATRDVKHNPSQRGEMDLWAPVFGSLPEVGRDFYLASCEGYVPSQVSNGGPCRFHWHRDPDHKDLHQAGDVVCPLASGASFVDWHKHIMPRDLHNVDATATTTTKLSKKEKKRLKKANVASLETMESGQTLESIVEACPVPEAEMAPEAEVASWNL